jgi:FkbM family methyltransferase
MRRIIKKFINILGIEAIKSDTYVDLINDRHENEINKIKIKLYSETNNPELLTQCLGKSHAQLFQDVVALDHFNFKKNGYFVEFGATDGKFLSNSFLLESNFNWNGIVAEPARVWHAELKKNRDCNICLDLISGKGNENVTFVEMADPTLSSVNPEHLGDKSRVLSKNSIKYKLNTITLENLLDKYKAPKDIDFLSIDVEGHELEILENFSFDKYSFKFIICEHAFGSDKEKLRRLFNKNGYKIIHEDISKQDFWLIPKNV